jgi:hypothetical protein
VAGVYYLAENRPRAALLDLLDLHLQQLVAPLDSGGTLGVVFGSILPQFV